jgi:hypothetical protein
MKFVVTKQYEVEVSEEALEAATDYYHEEWDAEERPSRGQVILALVEEFHVGDNTHLVTELTNEVRSEDQEVEVL